MLLARAYANLFYLVKDLTGLELPFLKLFQSFGFMVAMAFLVAAYFLQLELKRKEKLNILKPWYTEIWIGKGPSILEVLINGVVGFLVGFKGLALLLGGGGLLEDPQKFLLSSEGNVFGGLLGAAAFIGWDYYQKSKTKLDTPKKEKVEVFPHQAIGDITMMAAIGGIAGAKIFYFFESPGNFTNFLNDPVGSFFGGLTIYGGIVGGTLVVGWYARKKGIPFLQLADATAPSLFISYAIGRLGCQLAGDGDWGVPNMMVKPDWIPQWLWAQDYAHGVTVGASEGTLIEGCTEAYCLALTNPVWPTPIYEAIMATGLFLLLWSLRKRITIPGVLFSMYILLNGFERFWIEKIRVNTKFEFMGITMTQAEIIAVIFMLVGIAGIIYFRKKYYKAQSTTN